VVFDGIVCRKDSIISSKDNGYKIVTTQVANAERERFHRRDAEDTEKNTEGIPILIGICVLAHGNAPQSFDFLSDPQRSLRLCGGDFFLT